MTSNASYDHETEFRAAEVGATTPNPLARNQPGNPIGGFISTSFSTIPPDLKIPLFYAEFDNSRAWANQLKTRGRGRTS
jgi:hypothetical protein